MQGGFLVFYMGFQTVQVPGSNSSASRKFYDAKLQAQNGVFQILVLCVDPENSRIDFSGTHSQSQVCDWPRKPISKLFTVLCAKKMSKTATLNFSCSKSYAPPKSGARSAKRVRFSCTRGGYVFCVGELYCLLPHFGGPRETVS